MKSVRALLVALLISGSMTTVHAAIDTGDILWGAGIGVVARLGSKALKDQGKLDNGHAMLGAAFFATLGTLAVQYNNGGSMRRGLVQAAASVAAYIATMYIAPTKDTEKEDATVYATKR